MKKKKLVPSVENINEVIDIIATKNKVSKEQILFALWQSTLCLDTLERMLGDTLYYLDEDENEQKLELFCPLYELV